MEDIEARKTFVMLMTNRTVFILDYLIPLVIRYAAIHFMNIPFEKSEVYIVFFGTNDLINTLKIVMKS